MKRCNSGEVDIWWGVGDKLVIFDQILPTGPPPPQIQSVLCITDIASFEETKSVTSGTTSPGFFALRGWEWDVLLPGLTTAASQPDVENLTLKTQLIKVELSFYLTVLGERNTYCTSVITVCESALSFSWYFPHWVSWPASNWVIFLPQ